MAKHDAPSRLAGDGMTSSPPIDPALRASGQDLARQIASGVRSSRDILEAHLAEITRVNPTLNAMVQTRFEQARAEAEAADRSVREERDEELPPLHGVPCTVKECFAVKGFVQSAGLVSRRNHVATEDATAVARLKRAGAVIMGVTNLSELCMWMESSNRVYGRTNNPYDPTRIVGGSSGGEGAIIGAGASPWGLGSDIGGSIRMPAFFNGIFGHKATGGLVPGTGQFPIGENEATRYLCTGPLTRRAEDLMPLLRILAGPDGIDPGCEARPILDDDPAVVPKLRVLTVPEDGTTPVSPSLRSAQAAVADALAREGADVREATFAPLAKSFDIWSSMLGMAGGETFRGMLQNGSERGMGIELARYALGRSPHTFPALVLALLEKVTKLSSKRIRHFAALGHELKAALVDAIGPTGIMLYPSYASVAPKHHAPLLPPDRWVYTAILNVMELPVTQVPLGLDADGLPLGVQVVAVHGNDHLTIAVARLLERTFGGWTPPVL